MQSAEGASLDTRPVPKGAATQWRRRDSNPQPPRCKRGALPSELRPRTWTVPISRGRARTTNRLYLVPISRGRARTTNRLYLVPISRGRARTTNRLCLMPISRGRVRGLKLRAPSFELGTST